MTKPTPGTAKPPAAETVTLKKPIAGFEGEIKSLDLREPTWGDYVDIGDLSSQRMSHPDALTKTFGAVEIVDDGEKIMAWIERLSGVNANLLRGLSMADGRAAAAAVKRLVTATAAGN